MQGVRMSKVGLLAVEWTAVLAVLTSLLSLTLVSSPSSSIVSQLELSLAHRIRLSKSAQGLQATYGMPSGILRWRTIILSS